MEVVPNPRVEDHETNHESRCLDVCVELGEEDAGIFTLILYTAHLQVLPKGEDLGLYSLIFFKNPGVFNSRSSR